MATQEEIIQQYQEDRLDKILRLKTILSSRISQNAKAKANVINGVSVISTTLTIDDIFSVEELKTIYSRDGSSISDLKSQMKPIRKEIVDKLSERLDDPDSTVIFLIITCELINVSVSNEKEMLSCTLRVRDTLYVKEPGRPAEKLSASNTSNASGTSPVQWVEGSSFTDISKNLSGVSYPNENLQQSNKFENWLTDITMFQRFKELQPFETMPIFVHSEMSLGDFNLIFPKPDGLGQNVIPNPNGSGVPNISTASVSPTGSNNIPAGAPTGSIDTSVAGSSTVGTSDASDVSGTTTVSTPQNAKTSGSRYLSIEAVKDDDVLLRESNRDNVGTSGTSGVSRKFVSGRLLEDEALLLDRDYRDQDIKTTEERDLESITTGEPGDTGTGVETGIGTTAARSDVNETVARREKEERERQTAAEKHAEESDALLKLDLKIKLATSPAGPDLTLSDGVSAKKSARSDEAVGASGSREDAAPIDTNSAQAKTFLEWYGSEGRDPNGIIYRGGKNTFYKTTPANANINENSVGRYKNLFDYGRNLDKMFGDLKLESPIDVGLAMNGIQIGIFNKRIPYMFVEGCEVSLALVPESVGVLARPTEGGIGTYKKNGNWGNDPFWCGYFTDFVLYENKRYQSDARSSNIAGTSEVYKIGGRYDDSPVNKSYSQSAVTTLRGDIEGLNRQLTYYENSQKKKQKEVITLEKKLNKNKDAQLKINYNKANEELSAWNKNITYIKKTIAEKQKNKDNLENTSGFEINENNTVAKFKKGLHIDTTSNTFTEAGIALFQLIKNWKGAYIVNSGGHVEVLLHINKKGIIWTLGGNTGISINSETQGALKSSIKFAKPSDPVTGKESKNGYQYGFKTAPIGNWVGSNDAYIVKRGTKTPYTKGIGVGLIKTELWKQYEKIILEKSDLTVSSVAYDVIKNIFAK